MTHDTRLPVPHRARPAARGRGRGAPRSSRRRWASGLQRPWSYGRRARRVAGHLGPGRHHRAALPRRQRRLPAGEPARVGASLGISWYLGVDGISMFLVAHGRRAVPARPSWPGKAPRRPAVLRRLDAAARGGMPRELRLARPHPVLLVLRADPGAGLLHHRRLGLRPAGLRGHQVLRLHLPRLGLPVGGDPGPGLHPPAPDRRASPSPCVALTAHASGPRRRRCCCSWPSRPPSP